MSEFEEKVRSKSKKVKIHRKKKLEKSQNLKRKSQLRIFIFFNYTNIFLPVFTLRAKKCKKKRKYTEDLKAKKKEF